MSALTIVTGAAGFIGRNLVEGLNRRGHTNLLLVDTLGDAGKWTNLRGLEFEDLIQPNALLDWLNGSGGRHEVDAILHMGACSSTTEVDGDYLLENNYRYTRRLCEWALSSSTRFIYASSAATYGDGTLGYSDADDTTRQLRPLNMYGYSKQMFDVWALRQRALDKVVGLKFFNVYGPHEQHKGDMRSVVAKAYDEIVQTGSLSLFRSYRDDIADGEQRRDFIYVDDVVDVVMHFMTDRKAAGLFNCGTGLARTWLDLGRGVFAAMDRTPRIEYIDMPPNLRSAYQYFTQAETTKLREAGYATQFRTLEHGIDTYVRSYLAASDV